MQFSHLDNAHVLAFPIYDLELLLTLSTGEGRFTARLDWDAVARPVRYAVAACDVHG